MSSRLVCLISFLTLSASAFAAQLNSNVVSGDWNDINTCQAPQHPGNISYDQNSTTSAGVPPESSGSVTIPFELQFGGTTYSAAIPFTIAGRRRSSTGK